MGRSSANGGGGGSRAIDVGGTRDHRITQRRVSRHRQSLDRCILEHILCKTSLF